MNYKVINKHSYLSIECKLSPQKNSSNWLRRSAPRWNGKAYKKKFNILKTIFENLNIIYSDFGELKSSDVHPVISPTNGSKNSDFTIDFNFFSRYFNVKLERSIDFLLSSNP